MPRFSRHRSPGLFPTRSPGGLRRAFALVLGAFVLAAFAPAAPAGVAQAGQAGGATLTVRSILCPPGYAGEAWFDDCFDARYEGAFLGLNPEDEDPGGAIPGGSDAAGETRWENVAAGAYVLTHELTGSGIPVAENVVFCSVRGDPASLYRPELIPETAAAIEIPDNLAAAGGELVCDWYTIPAAEGAGGTPEATVDVPVTVLDCEQVIYKIDPTADFPPDGCVPSEGIVARVYAVAEAGGAGAEIGRCTTDADGECAVPVPSDGDGPAVIVRQDLVTLTDGYEQAWDGAEEPIEIRGDATSAFFVNIPTPGDPGTFAFPISVISCEEEPETASPFAGEFPPEGCAPVEGVIADVTLRDGSGVDACTTNAEGTCAIDAPFNATVIVEIDERTRPEAYAPRENPITTRVYTEFAGAVFVLIPALG